MYDAIVVGARCAGSPTAMLLARAGYKVLLVDRATFPSEIPNGHFIHRGGPRLLQHWGLLDRIRASNCPEHAENTTDFGDYGMKATDQRVDGVAWGYGPRRKVLDQILLDAAIEAGAEFRPGFSVESFQMDGERVAGIRAVARGGNALTERARITIGADGRNSKLAQTVRAEVYNSEPSLTCFYFTYFSGVQNQGFELYSRPGCAAFAFVTNEKLLTIFACWPIARFVQVRTDIETHFLGALDSLGDFGERVRAGRREERFYGTADLPNFFRKPFGPGWALVGDAGYHKDPYGAMGVADAFRDAHLLARAVDRGLSGQAPIDQALADYERQRNEDAGADYQENLQLARLPGPTAEALRLRAALKGNQEQINRFAMARVGMIPREGFFNPENLARLGMEPQTSGKATHSQ
ncbi:MAG TPA: NAD(P)/FAD-dependent oxidoreductase [Candidatus Eisenbacteria bacterium]|nr:NAD(P)/FAD-dependent oxidoreductase [Candidatus Eisenbacteria bacterium]